MEFEEEIHKFILICNKLSINSYLSTFSDRKRLQKIFYILKQFGLNFRVKYNWYKHGPYSPKLANIYYQVNKIQNQSEIIKNKSLNKSDLIIIEKANPFINDMKNSTNQLEYYASILFIKNDMIFTELEKNDKNIEAKTMQLKPNLFSPETYKEAIIKLKENCLA